VLRGHLFHRVHGVVEAAVDLQGVSAVCERLCQFALRYFALRDENEDREVGAGAICGQRSGGVTSGGADECTRSLMSGPAHGYSHAPVLEGARGVFSFVFGPEGRQAKRGGVQCVEVGAAFWEGDDVVSRQVQHEFAVAPDAGEVLREAGRES